jgi:hypothetical protein
MQVLEEICVNPVKDFPRPAVADRLDRPCGSNSTARLLFAIVMRLQDANCCKWSASRMNRSAITALASHTNATTYERVTNQVSHFASVWHWIFSWGGLVGIWAITKSQLLGRIEKNAVNQFISHDRTHLRQPAVIVQLWRVGRDGTRRTRVAECHLQQTIHFQIHLISKFVISKIIPFPKVLFSFPKVSFPKNRHQSHIRRSSRSRIRRSAKACAIYFLPASGSKSHVGQFPEGGIF